MAGQDLEHCQFDSLLIRYDARHVLEPRPWTAMQSRWAVELAATLPPGPILELCAGAGQIGLLAASLSGRSLVQVEADPVAASNAADNARQAGLGHLVEIRCAPMDNVVRTDESFNLILADPPYLCSGEVGRFPQDPQCAIDGGPDGLAVIRTSLAVVASHLAPGGACLLQVAGPAQATRVEALARHLGLTTEDLRIFDLERAVVLLRSAPALRLVAGSVPVDRANPITTPLSDRFEDALRCGDLTVLDAAEPNDDGDALATLLAIYDLWTAPLGELNGRERLQNHPAVASLKWKLEAPLLLLLDSWIGDDDLRASPDACDAMRRIAGRAGGEIYDWIASFADWEQLVAFLAIEGGPDGGFDDLVALCQVGIQGPAKVVLAENYWDEMGQGDPEAVHTVLHNRLATAIDLQPPKRGDLPISALRRAALNGLLATNRWLQPEMLGALGLLELQAGPRCRKVLRALTRLSAPAGAFPFYEEHAVTDPIHGRAWLDGAVRPLTQDRPDWAGRIIRGALWRSEVNRRLFTDVHALLADRRLISA